MANRKSRGSALHRIRKATVYEGDCWIYTGSPSVPEGKAPRVSENKIDYNIGQYAHMKFKGRVVNQVNHTCDRPRCWNPEHLYDGTQQQNVDDRMARGRHKYEIRKGSTAPNAIINEDIARQIKVMIIQGMKSGVIAKHFNIPAYLVYAIKSGYNWKHVEVAVVNN